MILIIYTFFIKVNSLHKKKKANSIFVHFIYLSSFCLPQRPSFSADIHIFYCFTVYI